MCYVVVKCLSFLEMVVNALMCFTLEEHFLETLHTGTYIHTHSLTDTQTHTHTRTHLQVCFDRVYTLHETGIQLLKPQRQLNTHLPLRRKKKTRIVSNPVLIRWALYRRRSVTRRGTCIIEKIICGALLLSSPKADRETIPPFLPGFLSPGWRWL